MSLEPSSQRGRERTKPKPSEATLKTAKPNTHRIEEEKPKKSGEGVGSRDMPWDTFAFFSAPGCFLSLPGIMGSSIVHGVGKRHRRGTESRHPERDGERASVSIYSPQDTFTWLTGSSLTTTLGGVDVPLS